MKKENDISDILINQVFPFSSIMTDLLGIEKKSRVFPSLDPFAGIPVKSLKKKKAVKKKAVKKKPTKKSKRKTVKVSRRKNR